MFNDGILMTRNELIPREMNGANLVILNSRFPGTEDKGMVTTYCTIEKVFVETLS